MHYYNNSSELFIDENFQISKGIKTLFFFFLNNGAGKGKKYKFK